MREAVIRLVEMGPFPPESTKTLTIEQVDTYANLAESIEPPVTNEEAEALCKLFGEDTFYGIAWTIMHLIESAPGWPLKSCLANIDNIWVLRLRRRAENDGLL